MGEERFPVTLMDAALGEFGIGTWTWGELGTCPAPSPHRCPGRTRIPSTASMSRIWAALAAARSL